MFTTCRGSCLTTSETVRELRLALGPVFGKRLTFASFTLEPAVDTPGRLREYAARYGADRPAAELPDWHFLTGAQADIDRLRRSLGLYDLNPAVDADLTQHASVLLFGNDGRDRWAVLPAGLRRGLLVESIRRVAGFTFEQRYGIRA
jgi:protein SCO1/2